ncbi:hypothetical protein G3N95_30975 [Paraburkholderia sp. Tr-20389]|uniref:hypothetical protein n=1 Tax=Paraburkholderia sp. Tr-20389 TaxID=2703903 RepID=UPI00197D844A|nr:hypothetical protein [Paraburkholderia sp. Tr-20389]MBN3757392.1 hypothetical protein [Paraburkholderia sp. Tr-20389]
MPGQPVTRVNAQTVERRCTNGCDVQRDEIFSHEVAQPVDIEPAEKSFDVPDFGGWFGGERPLTVSVRESVSTVDETIAANVATANQTDGAAKLMLLGAALPAAFPVSGEVRVYPLAATAR